MDFTAVVDFTEVVPVEVVSLVISLEVFLMGGVVAGLAEVVLDVMSVVSPIVEVKVVVILSEVVVSGVAGDSAEALEAVDLVEVRVMVVAGVDSTEVVVTVG